MLWLDEDKLEEDAAPACEADERLALAPFVMSTPLLLPPFMSFVSESRLVPRSEASGSEATKYGHSVAGLPKEYGLLLWEMVVM